MKINNSIEALQILENAMNQLNRLNYYSSVSWAEEADAAKDHVQYVIDKINDDIHASDSLIHPENQF